MSTPYHQRLKNLERHETMQPPDRSNLAETDLRRYGEMLARPSAPLARGRRLLAVMGRHGSACIYCGSRDDLTQDHFIPRSRGGPSALENLVPACAPCNTAKGNLMPLEFAMKRALGVRAAAVDMEAEGEGR